MPSSYSPLLRLELIGAGDQSGLWGDTTNKNLGTLLEQAIAGVTTISLSGGAGTYTLSSLNGTQDEARSAVLKFIGNPSGEKIIEIPSREKLYVARNESGQKITFKTSAQILNPALGGVELLDDESSLVFCDGSNAVPGIQTQDVGTLTVPGGGTGAVSFAAGFIKSPGGTGNLTSVSSVGLASADVSGVLPTTKGGTGLSAVTAGRLLIGDGTNPVGLLGGSTQGQVVTWDGTQWIPQTPAAQATFVTGMILLWSGSISNVPSGWGLCNGANGTPDLRDRFVIGAGNNFAVNATGGASAVTLLAENLPSHTHSVSVSGSTTAADASHSHSLSGSTGAADATHNHTFGPITSSGQSQSHSHRLVATTSSAGSHSHTVASGATNNAGGQPGTTDIGTAVTQTTSTAPDHTHSINQDTGSASVDHTHSVSGTTASTSASHSHALSGTTASASASHSHTYSFNGTSGATGMGTSFSILPPYYALAYIMKL